MRPFPGEDGVRVPGVDGRLGLDWDLGFRSKAAPGPSDDWVWVWLVSVVDVSGEAGCALSI